MIIYVRSHTIQLWPHEDEHFQMLSFDPFFLIDCIHFAFDLFCLEL